MPADTAQSRLLKALSHPLRVRILEVLDGRESASPSELAEVLDEPLQQIVYHVRRLAQLDYIELVEERTRRGTIEHFYRRTQRAWFGRDDWSQLSPQKRQAISGALLEETWRDVMAAFGSGAFDARTDRHLSHTRMMLDEQAWQELSARLGQVLDEAHELAAQSVQRAHEAGPEAKLFPCRLVMMNFTVEERGRRDEG
jgi:DNA-binding transcriptional ArsR family regulator